MTSARIGRSEAARCYALAAAATLVTCAAIVAVHRNSIRTLVSAHGLLHVAIAERFMTAGAAFGRPENPFFAGERLPYYWFYHYVAARLASLSGVHVLFAFEALALLGVALVWFAGAAIGRRLGWGTPPALAIGLLSLAGANALGCAILAAKLAAGQRWPADSTSYLWGLTHPVMGLLRVNDPGALYGPIINFFLNTTSRPLALGLVVVLLLPLLRYLQQPTLSALGALAIASAACTIFSPIIGLLAAAALAGGLLLDWWWSRDGAARTSTPAGFRQPAAIGALMTGCVATAPTYYQLFDRSAQPGMIVGLRPGLLATIVVSISPLLLLVAVGLVRLPAARRYFGILAAAGSALVFGNAFLQLPAGNDSNLFHVGAIMLAVPAAGAFHALDAWPRGARRVAWALLLLVFVSTPLMVIRAYWNRPPVPLAVDGARLRREPVGSPLSAAYDWIRSSTPADAVFVVDGELLMTTFLGNVPEFPALTDRLVFVSPEPDYMVEVYPDANRRRDIASRILSGAMTSADTQYVTNLGMPMLTMVGERSAEVMSRLRSAYGAPLFHAPGVVIFRAPGARREAP